MAYQDTILATAGLQSYYRLGETAGVTLTDLKGGRHATLSGGYTLNVPGAITNDANGAVRFDGATGQALAPNGSAALIAGTGMSLEAWVRLAPVLPPNHGAIIAVRNDTDADFYFLQLSNTNQIECRFRNSAAASFTLTITLSTDVWHYMVMTYDGATLTVTVDDSAVVSMPATGTITNGAVGLFFGNDLNGNHGNMSVDEVALYNVALSPATISSHYRLPSLTGITPLSVQAGAPGVNLVCTGTNFTPSTVVSWNGQARTTVYTSSTQLSASIPASDVAAAGTAVVNVIGSGSGSGQTFTITSPPSSVPVLNRIQPSAIVEDSPGFTLTCDGTGFTPSTVVTWNGVTLTTHYVSPTRLTADVPASYITTPGTDMVDVR